MQRRPKSTINAVRDKIKERENVSSATRGRIRWCRLSRCSCLFLGVSVVIFINFRNRSHLNVIYDQSHSTSVAKERFLLYYSHSGLTNQLMAIERAAKFAFATNRTLVLPPLLPHGTSNYSNYFSVFKPRTAGNKCQPYERYEKYIDIVRTDVEAASDSKIKFPSFLELFDFDDFSQKNGMKVIDMREFAKDPNKSDPTLWCTGGRHKIKTKMNPSCDGTNKTSFSDLVPQFQDACNSNQTVAVIGSAFVMPYPESLKRSSFSILPSQKFLSVIKKLHSRLPQNYTGVHIRFKDGLKIYNCDKPSVKEAYANILIDLKEQNVPSKGHIFIGNGNRLALECFNHHAKELYTASTVNDIIGSDKALKRAVDEIETEKGAIYIMLDQILIALAEKVSFQKIQTTAGTFQMRISHLHKVRDLLLNKMHAV